jgi:hypothetical protein
MVTGGMLDGSNFHLGWRKLLRVLKRGMAASFSAARGLWRVLKVEVFSRVNNPLRLSSSLASVLLSFFGVAHHPVNRDDRHLLAHALASDFTVACQFSQREQLVKVKAIPF